MNNNHPFLPRASNNISIEKSNDAVTWLKISMITSNILFNKTKRASDCAFTDTCQGFQMLTLSFVGERKNLRPQQPIWVSALSNITFQRQICFSNKGLFEEAINLHAIIPWLLSLCYALFFLFYFLGWQLLSFQNCNHSWNFAIICFFFCFHRRLRSYLLWRFA